MSATPTHYPWTLRGDNAPPPQRDPAEWPQRQAAIAAARREADEARGVKGEPWSPSAMRERLIGLAAKEEREGLIDIAILLRRAADLDLSSEGAAFSAISFHLGKRAGAYGGVYGIMGREP